jgi:NDP-sugar pyrophosphorylase family protein
VEYLKRYGITQLIVNVHHFAGQVLEAIEENKGWGSQIMISDETTGLLETGGALVKASWYLDSNPFAVINADILTDLSLDLMIRQHLQLKPLATLAVTSRPSSRCFLFNEQNQLCGWKNKSKGEERISRKDQETLVEKSFSGVHLIDPRIFDLILQRGKFSIVETYLELSAAEPIHSFDHSGSLFIDVGKPEAIAEAEGLFKY